MKDCPKKQCIISAVAVFIFMYLYEMVLHGMLLKGMYEETSTVWRMKEDMGILMPWTILYYILMSLLSAAIYGCCVGKNKAACDAGAMPEGKKQCPKKEAVTFGLTLGLFLGLVRASFSPYLPIPLELAVAWF